LLEQETAAAVIYRRGETGFVREVHQGTAAVVPQAEVGCTLPLAEVYENVGLKP
jgi:hypothetical protein